MDPKKDCDRDSEESEEGSAERAQTTIISGSLIVAQSTGLAGTHAGRVGGVAGSGGRRDGQRSRNNSQSSDEDSEMEDMIRNLRGIAMSRNKQAPSHQQSAAIDDRQEVDEEMDSMIRNLRDVASATSVPLARSGPTTLSHPHHAAFLNKALLSTPHQQQQQEEGEEEYTSDSEDSESSFEADVLIDGHPAHLTDTFPLPSWPNLHSSSQSPFNQLSLLAPAFRPAECSVSLSPNSGS